MDENHTYLKPLSLKEKYQSWCFLEGSWIWELEFLISWGERNWICVLREDGRVFLRAIWRRRENNAWNNVPNNPVRGKRPNFPSSIKIQNWKEQAYRDVVLSRWLARFVIQTWPKPRLKNPKLLWDMILTPLNMNKLKNLHLRIGKTNFKFFKVKRLKIFVSLPTLRKIFRS